MLPVFGKLRIYHALFKSQLNYWALVWFRNTKANVNRLPCLAENIKRHIANLKPLSTTRNAGKLSNIIGVEHIYINGLSYGMQFSHMLVADLITRLACLERLQPIVNTGNPDKWVNPHFRTCYQHQSLAYNLRVTK